MRSCMFSLKAAENGQILPCRFLVCRFGDVLLFGNLSFLEAFGVFDDGLLPDFVLSWGSSVDWFSFWLSQCRLGLRSE